MEMIEMLKTKYNYNEPILLKQVDIPDMSEDAIRQAFSRMVKLGQIERFERGVYYIPRKTPIGKSRLSASKVYEKKYISDDNGIFGFYSGVMLENMIGLTNQVPNVIEIITNKESSKNRVITVGNQRVRLKRSRVKINEYNYSILQLLELINQIDLNSLSEKSIDKLRKYVRTQSIKRRDVDEFLSKFPSRTEKNIIESGIISEFT